MFEFFLEFLSSFFKQAHIGLAISHKFVVEVEFLVSLASSLVPCFKFFFSFYGHALWIVVVLRRNRFHIVLIVSRFEEVGKETFLGLVEAKRFAEFREGHLQERHAVDEFETVLPHAKDFGSVDDLIWTDTLFVKFVQDEVTVVALEVVSHVYGNDGAFYFWVVSFGAFT